MATHSSILVWRMPVDRGAWWATVHGAATHIMVGSQSVVCFAVLCFATTCMNLSHLTNA